MTDTPRFDELLARAADFDERARRVQDPLLRKQFRELSRRFANQAASLADADAA